MTPDDVTYVAPRLASIGYAAPVLANVPLVQFREGDFSYNGLRGLGQDSGGGSGGPPASTPGINVGFYIPGSWLVLGVVGYLLFREFDIAKFQKSSSK